MPTDDNELLKHFMLRFEKLVKGESQPMSTTEEIFLAFYESGCLGENIGVEFVMLPLDDLTENEYFAIIVGYMMGQEAAFESKVKSTYEH